ncbi:unnamed protein product [Ectocarpus sp. 12 AP-2014]
MASCRHDHEEAGGGEGGGDGHDHSHGHSHDHSHDPEDPDGMSLFGLIDTTRVRCLNESAPGSGLSCLKPWDKRRDPQPRLESEEDDPELIIYVPFTQVVKIRAISVTGGGEGSAPSAMKVFVNRDDIDFGLAQDLPAVQTLEMVRDSGGVEVDYPTKLSKMQNVSDITLFVPSNFGADSTVITYLGFKGESTKFRHGVVECVYEAKPNAEDHKAPSGETGGRNIL